MEPVSRPIRVAPEIDLRVITAGLEGPGVPILLVHGLASNARLWDGVTTDLALLGHPVAAVDQRGHGRSTKTDNGFDFETLTSDLAAVIRELGWERCWVAGQSWGANVALATAVLQPRVVAGLVLIDGGTGDLAERFADWATCEAALAPPHLEGMKADDFERLIRSGHPDWPEAGISGTLANVEVLEDGTIRPWLSRANHMKILRQMWDNAPSKLHPQVRVPVLILAAESTGNARWMAVKREDVARATKALERSVARFIEGDHDLHAQHPAVVAELVEAATGPTLFPK